ncbi:MAG: PIN-like domain-containing protein [Erysipelotrichaceae bacterium]|nr:PIN-like domain-containing protein [Erysipelotrichaceae bacterium]
MDKTAYDIYNLDEINEKELWEDCVFVFDTSALLDFYLMTSELLETLVLIFDKVKMRLMLPNHVQYEYLKNRKSVINKLCSCYSDLEVDYLDKIDKDYATIINRIDEIESKVKLNKTHPTLDTEFINVFKEKAKDLKPHIELFKAECEKQIQSQIKKISGIIEDDPVMDLIDKCFIIGRHYDFHEMMHIVEEGKLRNEFKIPPGYRDAGKMKKSKDYYGTQIFGDLIIWKQTIEYASNAKSNIVFVTNDTSKGDWCETDSRKRVTRPHNDLIKEIYDASGKRFWMYTLEQFLFCSNRYLSVNVPDDQIKQAYGILTSKDESIGLSFRCGCCGAVNKQSIEKSFLEYELVESHERQMGCERHFEAEAFLNCTKCHQEVIALLSIWEYPEDCANLSEIELSGADLISYDQFTRDCYEDHWEEICADMYAEDMYNHYKGK